MKSLAKNILFITVVALVGVVVSLVLFDVKPTVIGVLVALAVPAVTVVFSSWARGRADRRFILPFASYMIFITLYAGWKYALEGEWLSILLTWLVAAVFGAAFWWWYSLSAKNADNKDTLLVNYHSERGRFTLCGGSVSTSQGKETETCKLYSME